VGEILMSSAASGKAFAIFQEELFFVVAPIGTRFALQKI
jgi:hypothetical protein